MVNKKVNLSKKIFTLEIEKKFTRDGFAEGLVNAGEKDERIVVLTADLKESTRVNLFADKFPERFIEVGVAEQSLVTTASGLANYGKIPFTTTYAVFSPGRTWEQIRTTICLNDVPVKIIGCHAGLGAGPYGASHQGTEDIAMMRILPNMIVVVPCDYEEARKATLEVAKNGKPTYLRLAREETPVFTTKDTPFKIGKAEVFWESTNNQQSTFNNSVAIIVCGPLVYEALLAAKELEKQGIGVIVVNNHTIKPMDKETIIGVAIKCGAVVTVEDHQVAGGMGSAVAEVLVSGLPAGRQVPMEFIGMQDVFGESGEPDELLTKYKMKSADIITACKKVILRKTS